MAWYEEIESHEELAGDECSALAAAIVFQCIQDVTSAGRSADVESRRGMALYDLQSRYMAILATGAGVDLDAWKEYVARLVAQSGDYTRKNTG